MTSFPRLLYLENRFKSSISITGCNISFVFIEIWKARVHSLSLLVFMIIKNTFNSRTFKNKNEIVDVSESSFRFENSFKPRFRILFLMSVHFHHNQRVYFKVPTKFKRAYFKLLSQKKNMLIS